MNLDWPNLLVGAILGFFAHWAFVALEKYFVRRKLEKVFGSLAGDYANFRVKDNGTEDATGGTIKLTWQHEGSFRAQGLHPTGVAEWESIIQMSLELRTGAGVYREIESHDHGTQQVTYLENARLFSVSTTVTSRTNKQPFIHHWKRKVT